MATTATPTRDVTAAVRYFARDPPAEGLDDNGVHAFIVAKGASKEEFKKARHRVTEVHDMHIVDARTVPGGTESYTLEKNGLMFISGELPPAMPDFTDKKAVKAEYFPKLLEIVKKHTGATRGFMMSYEYRTENPVTNAMAYAGFAHTDAGPGQVAHFRRSLLRLGVPEEEAESCDLGMFNLWHPYDRPAFKNPLCLLDASSCPPGLLPDGAPVETVKFNAFPRNAKKLDVAASMDQDALLKARGVKSLPFFQDQDIDILPKQSAMDPAPFALGPLYLPTNRWVYCSDMRTDEAWLFKQFDTREDGRAKCSFHTAFYDPFHDKNPDTPGRRSCEFRFLLTFPKAASSKL